jgi:hypothetical protein
VLHRNDRQLQLDGLSPPERIVLSFSRFVVAHPPARKFALVYAVAPHRTALPR